MAKNKQRSMRLLEASCELKTPDEIDLYLQAVADLRGQQDQDVLRLMLRCLRDPEAGEVQYELVGAIESFSPSGLDFSICGGCGKGGAFCSNLVPVTVSIDSEHQQRSGILRVCASNCTKANSRFLSKLLVNARIRSPKIRRNTSADTEVAKRAAVSV